MESAYKSLIRIALSEEPSQETLRSLSEALLDSVKTKGKQEEELLLSILSLPERNLKFTLSSLEEVLHSSIKLINELNDSTVSTLSFQRLYTQVSKLPYLLEQQALIINYLGPLLRKQGKLEQARQLLEKAIKLIESHPRLQVDKAATCLNYCAILSSLSRHQEAYEFALKGLNHIQDKFKSLPNEQDTQVLATAYFNVACELEHLKKFKKCMIWYNKNIEFIKASVVTPVLASILEDCQKNLQKVKDIIRGTSVKPPTRPLSKADKSHSFVRRTKPFKEFDARFPISEQPFTFEELRQRLEISKKLGRARAPSIKESSSVDMILHEFKFASRTDERKFILKESLWENTAEVEIYLKKTKIEVLLLFKNSRYNTEVDRNPILTLENDIKYRILPNIILKNSVLVMNRPVFKKNCHLSGIAFSIEIYEGKDCKKVLAYNRKSEAFLLTVHKQQVYEDIVQSLTYANNTLVFNNTRKEQRARSARQRENSRIKEIFAKGKNEYEFYSKSNKNISGVNNRNNLVRLETVENSSKKDEQRIKIFTRHGSRRKEDYPRADDINNYTKKQIVGVFKRKEEFINIAKNNHFQAKDKKKAQPSSYTVHELATHMANRDKNKHIKNRNILEQLRTTINGKEYQIYLTTHKNKNYLICEDESTNKWTYVERGYPLQDLLKGLIFNDEGISIDYTYIGLPRKQENIQSFKARYSKNPKYSVFIHENSGSSIHIDVYYGIDLKKTLIVGKAEALRKAGSDDLSMSALSVFIANHMIDYQTLELLEDTGTLNLHSYALKIQSAFRNSLSIRKLISTSVKKIGKQYFQIKCFQFKTYIQIVANHKALHFSLFINKNSEKRTATYVEEDIIPRLYIANGKLHVNSKMELTDKLYSDIDLFDFPSDIQRSQSCGRNTPTLEYFQASERYSPRECLQDLTTLKHC